MCTAEEPAKSEPISCCTVCVGSVQLLKTHFRLTDASITSRHSQKENSWQIKACNEDHGLHRTTAAVMLDHNDAAAPETGENQTASRPKAPPRHAAWTSPHWGTHAVSWTVKHRKLRDDSPSSATCHTKWKDFLVAVHSFCISWASSKKVLLGVLGEGEKSKLSAEQERETLPCATSAHSKCQTWTHWRWLSDVLQTSLFIC